VLYNLYTYTSLPQNLTSDQEKLPNNPSGGKKGRNLQESNRGGSLPRMDRCNRCNVYRRTDLELKYIQ